MQGPQCTRTAATLPFGGVCPSTELVCPVCPQESPIKCPMGGCATDVRDCPPNVFFRGDCNASVCTEVHWCHVLVGLPYACWEQAPSAENATLSFVALDQGTCGICTHLISRYQCNSCCGTRAVARWSGSYQTGAPDRRGGGVFMDGSRWVCLLRDVAASFHLENAAAELFARPPPPPPTLPPSPPPPPPMLDLDALNFPMPAEYDLSLR